MNHQFAEHLTDEQFSDLLCGETPTGVVAAHLEACDHCRREVAAVQSSVDGFNRFSLAWAQVQAPRRVRTPSRWLVFLTGQPTWRLGVAGTAMACVIAMGGGLLVDHVHDDTTSPPKVLAGPSEAELAADNRLLESIDADLHYDAELVVPPSDLGRAGRRAEHHLAGTVSN